MKKSLPQFFFLLVVIIVTAAFFGLIGGFMMAIFWAIVFAILFYGRYEKFLNRFKNKPNLSAALTVLYILLIVIIPLTIVAFAVIDEAGNVYEQFQDNDLSIQEQITDIQEAIPIDNSLLRKFGLNAEKIRTNVTTLVTTGTKALAGQALTFTQNIFGFVVNFFLMLYILFFFLRDGKRLIQELIWVIPIGDKQELQLLQRFESVARATVKGSLLVAMAQGVMGGILFALVGIEAAFLWGVFMVLASLLPVGSALIWGPWAIVMFWQGEFGRGMALLIVGACFIGLIDNILRPRLVGQDTKMPDYLVLLSTLGGLTWFGLSGFVIGPIIAALFVTCWQMLGREYGKPRELVVTAPTAEELGKEE